MRRLVIYLQRNYRYTNILSANTSIKMLLLLSVDEEYLLKESIPVKITGRLTSGTYPR
jgi:hypothetical protein